MPPASKYWADWVTHPHEGGPLVIRKDTRMFWKDQTTGTTGKCVGCFIGENPGGAQSIHGLAFTGYSPIEDGRDDGDGTLRFLHEIWEEAVRIGVVPERAEDDYIEILNTYYVRHPQSGVALADWRAAGGSKLYCPSPSASADFILLGWGVNHTTNSEAVAMVPLLAGANRVIIPCSDATVRVCPGKALPCPVVPGPVQPSYILRNSKRLKSAYFTNVAKEFR